MMIFLARVIFVLGSQGPVVPHRRQLPHGERLLVEGRSRETEAVRPEGPTAPPRGEACGGASDSPLLRRCVSSDLGAGSGIPLLVAGGATLLGRHGQWTE